MMRRVSTRTLCATALRTASLVGTRISAWLVDLFIVVVVVVLVVGGVVGAFVGVVGVVDEMKMSAWLVDLFVADVAFVEE